MALHDCAADNNWILQNAQEPPESRIHGLHRVLFYVADPLPTLVRGTVDFFRFLRRPQRFGVRMPTLSQHLEQGIGRGYWLTLPSALFRMPVGFGRLAQR
jgi:hypothetical protein